MVKAVQRRIFLIATFTNVMILKHLNRLIYIKSEKKLHRILRDDHLPMSRVGWGIIILNPKLILVCLK